MIKEKQIKVDEKPKIANEVSIGKSVYQSIYTAYRAANVVYTTAVLAADAAYPPHLLTHAWARSAHAAAYSAAYEVYQNAANEAWNAAWNAAEKKLKI